MIKGVQADRGHWHALLVRKREGDRWAEYFAGRHKRTEGTSRRRKADHIYSKADRPSATVLAAPKPHSLPSTLQTTNRRYPSTPRTSGIRLGALLEPRIQSSDAAGSPLRPSQISISCRRHQLLRPGHPSRDCCDTPAARRLPRCAAKSEIRVARAHRRSPRWLIL